MRPKINHVDYWLDLTRTTKGGYSFYTLMKRYKKEPAVKLHTWSGSQWRKAREVARLESMFRECGLVFRNKYKVPVIVVDCDLFTEAKKRLTELKKRLKQWHAAEKKAGSGYVPPKSIEEM